jgi:hypothetical protein
MAAREPATGTADPAAVQGEPGKEPAKTDGAKEAAGTRLTAMHIAGLAVLILGILVVLLIVMPEFNDDRDTVTGVLGGVIPALPRLAPPCLALRLATTPASPVEKRQAKRRQGRRRSRKGRGRRGCPD